MDFPQFLKENKDIIEGLKDTSEIFGENIPYFITGSVCLISNSKGQYFRKINDIDIVADIEAFPKIKESFENRGYETRNFREVGPFLLRLAKSFSVNDYFRFKKGECVVDVVGARFNKDKSVDVRYLPFITLHISKKAALAKEMEISGIYFKTNPIESLYLLKEFYGRTAGRVTKDKKPYRKADISVSEGLVDKNKINEAMEDCFLKVFFLRISLNRLI